MMRDMMEQLEELNGDSAAKVMEARENDSVLEELKKLKRDDVVKRLRKMIDESAKKDMGSFHYDLRGAAKTFKDLRNMDGGKTQLPFSLFSVKGEWDITGSGK